MREGPSGSDCRIGFQITLEAARVKARVVSVQKKAALSWSDTNQDERK